MIQSQGTRLFKRSMVAAWAAALLGLAGVRSPEAAATQWRVENAFPHMTFADPVALAAAPVSGWIYVAEQEGLLLAFPPDSSVREKVIVLEITTQTQGGFGKEDCGLLGFAFHPEFGKAGSPNRGFLYVYYNYSDKPVVPPAGQKLSSDTHSRNRLSRFTVPDGTLQADPKSELVLIDQTDTQTWHNGGGMFFNPMDGFLYLTNGDEGCNCHNDQKLDKSLFSGVFRIDVDNRGGSVSHSIRRQPVNGKTAYYSIPNDNPFVGDGMLEEFWALGLRSPHRMTYDAPGDLIWLGDVGNGYREEVDIVRKGANYQWTLEEGPSQHPKPAAAPGIWTDPIHYYDHQGSSNAIIGGYVYRGCANAEDLGGKYVFGDFGHNTVSAMTFNPSATLGAEKTQVDELLTLPLQGDYVNGLTSFGVDAKGELYLLTLGQEAKIWKLAGPHTRTDCANNAIRPQGNAAVTPFPVRSGAGGIIFDAPDGLAYTVGITALDGRLLAQASPKGRFIFHPGPGGFPAGVVLVRIGSRGRVWNFRTPLLP
ncbi:MAG: Immunoglobulin I-set domain protein [Fibrobacteres bacterium]|nr:Immunoglobulin I-set domain protein [Fibrobacterota bacterium]